MSGASEIFTIVPGSIIQLQSGTINGRPAYVEYTHEELITLLTKKARRSSRGQHKLSRQVGLLCRAITTGKWSTGATIDVNNTIDKLIALLEAVPYAEVSALTPAAKAALQGVASSTILHSRIGNSRRRLIALLP